MNRTIIRAVFLVCSIWALAFTVGCTRNKFVPKVQEGLTVYQDGGKYGYAGKLGGTNTRLEARYDFAWPFSEGLAVVELNRKQGYINESGEIVIPVDFDRAYEFSDGMARVRKGDRYAFIDKKGKNQTGFEYVEAADFKNGTARVRTTNHVGIIDKRGRFVEIKDDSPFRYRPLNY